MMSKPETGSSGSDLRVNAGRDLRFDSLRGLFLVCMTINHLPNALRTVTDQSLGVFSAAEGFVFLSGLLAGIVYTRKFRKGGREGLRTAAIGRAQTIYNWHFGSFVACLGIVQLMELIFGFCSSTSPQMFYEHPLQALALGATFLLQPGLLDLLPMYCCFVALLVWVIPALEAGRRNWVLAISGLLWVVNQWAPPIDGDPLYPLNVGTFNIFAWQFLFVLGIVIGHARACGIPQVSRANPVTVIGALALAVYAFGLRHYQWPPLWPTRIYGIFLNKPALGLFRMGDFAAIAYLVAVIGARFPRLLTWPPLAFLGQHSLQVVAAQSVAVMALLQFDGLFATETRRTLTAFLAVALVYGAAGLHLLLRPSKPTAIKPTSDPSGSRFPTALAQRPSDPYPKLQSMGLPKEIDARQAPGLALNPADDIRAA